MVFISMSMRSNDSAEHLRRRVNSVNISSMMGTNQRGEANVLAIPLILAGVLLIASIIFGAWAFTSREDFRLNVEEKIAAAVKVAKQEESVAKDKEHAEADKLPLKPYRGPEPYGSVEVIYPKTWSGYVATGNSSEPLDGYFHPDIVPGLDDKSAAYALRVQVVNQSYSQFVASKNGDVKAKKVTATPFAFAKVPNTVGVRFDGVIVGTGRDALTGSLVAIPLRDKTLKVWTESPQYVADFNTHILPNISFVP